MPSDPIRIEPIPQWVELAKQTVLIGSAVLFYFAVRGLTEGAEATAIENGRWVLAREHDVGIDLERSIQGWTDLPFLTTLMNWVYIWGHWPVIVATLLWLHHSRIDGFLLLRNAMFVSGAIGLVIFVTVPVAPPRLIDLGFIDTVTQNSSSYRVLQPPGLVNKYAAIPSLHVGWNVLVGIVLFRTSRSRVVRTFAIVAPLLMAFAVVATANHYVVDGFIGSLVALAGLWISSKMTMPLVELDRRVRERVSSPT